MRIYSLLAISEIAHEVKRSLCLATREAVPPPWEELSDQQQEVMKSDVQSIYDDPNWSRDTQGDPSPFQRTRDSVVLAVVRGLLGEPVTAAPITEHNYVILPEPISYLFFVADTWLETTVHYNDADAERRMYELHQQYLQECLSQQLKPLTVRHFRFQRTK